MHTKQSWVALGGTTVLLFLLVFLAVRPYGGNVSALLHMDARFGARHSVPAGIALYEDAGYDGMLYYEVARDIPALFSGRETSLDSPYRFQRILLPLFAYILTLGDERALPYAFLAINIGAALGALALTLSIVRRGEAKPLRARSNLRRPSGGEVRPLEGRLSLWRRGSIIHSLTVVMNPAVFVGILFSLTEPLSLFFIVLFFTIWQKNDQRLNVASVSALTLSLLARETTVFFISLLLLWFLRHRQWREVLWGIVPLLLLVLWQGFLTLRLGDIAFQANSNIVDIPLGGPFTLLRWSLQDMSAYRLSAMSLLLFLLFLSFVLTREWIRTKGKVDLPCFLLSGLVAVMFTMDAHIWGVITSIGRVIAPLYPVYALYASDRDTQTMRLLSALLITISVVAALGIASVRHPFVIS